MLAIEDKWVVLAYVLCIASAALWVVYGIVAWNRGIGPASARRAIHDCQKQKRAEPRRPDRRLVYPRYDGCRLHGRRSVKCLFQQVWPISQRSGRKDN